MIDLFDKKRSEIKQTNIIETALRKFESYFTGSSILNCEPKLAEFKYNKQIQARSEQEFNFVAVKYPA